MHCLVVSHNVLKSCTRVKRGWNYRAVSRCIHTATDAPSSHPSPRSRQASSLLVRNAEQEASTSSVSRSDILRQGGLASIAGVLALTGSGNILSSYFTPLSASAADAATVEEQSYFDEKYKVAFEHVPKAWERTDTTIGTNNLDPRRIVVFKDPNSQANVFIAYTVRTSPSSLTHSLRLFIHRPALIGKQKIATTSLPSSFPPFLPP